MKAIANVRIDLAGGWTDIIDFCSKYTGVVVNFTIDIKAYIELNRRNDDKVLWGSDSAHCLSARNLRYIEEGTSRDLLLAAIKRFRKEEGLELFTHSNAPPGSGLGGSASIGVASVYALKTIFGKDMSKAEVAKLAHEIEVEDLGIKGGKQDQYAAAFGGVNYLEFIDESVSREALSLDKSFIDELEKRVILFYTGESRLSGDIHNKVWDNFRDNRKGIRDALLKMRDVAYMMKDALSPSQLNKIGQLVTKNWQNQLRLDNSITNAKINSIFSLAAGENAMGYKMCGAGGGGCGIVIVNTKHRASLETKLGRIVKLMPFKFDFSGVREPRSY